MSPLKCRKSVMADEAEEFMWINGSEGMTARCVEGIGPPPCITEVSHG